MGMKITYPMTRFGGWQNLGAVKRPADTRTAEDLIETLKAWAKVDPVVEGVLPKLKNLDKKYLGLAADTVELANRKSMLPLDINLKSMTNLGIRAHQFILNSIPIAAQKNPAALDFTQEVINNTDTLTSKVFLHQTTGGVWFNTKVSEHFKAAKPLVEFFAKKSFEHPRIYDFGNQRHFMELVVSVIDEDADVEKIKLVKDIYSKMNDKENMYISNFVKSKVPADKIRDNLSSIDKVNDLLKSKGKQPVDTEAYLLNNTNLY